MKRGRMILTSGILFLFFIVLGPQRAWGQFSSNIQGVATDPSGAAIPGATLTLTNTATGVAKTTQTDAHGNYHFVSVAPGRYRLQAHAQGFSNTGVEINLQTGETLNMPFSLKVQALQQQVEVTAQPPVLDTADSRSQMTLGQTALATLPLAGRSVLTLMTLAPGVEGLGVVGGGSPGSAVDNYSTETQVDASANGRSSVGNMYVVDGLDITSDIRPGVLNLSPNPDSIQEVSIQTNTFNVLYGRASSMQVLMTTKSGTNQFHGNASDYFTYQNLWSGTEFIHQYAPFHSNNFSGSLGGPILPKRQWFFFGSVEPLRSLTSTGNSVQTFEAPQFVQFAKQNFPNTLGTQLLTAYPPSGATITGVAQTAANVFPTTCGTPGAANIPCNLPMIDTGIFNATDYRNGLQYNIRIDKYFTKDRIYGNYYRTGLDTGGPAIRQGMATTNHFIAKSLQLNETHTFTPSTLNEAEFGLMRVEGITPQTGNFKVPVVNVQSVGVGIGDGFADGDFIQHNYHWRDVLTQIRGAHTLEFGYEGWHGDDLALFAPVYAQPNFFFTNLLNLVEDQPYNESSLSYNPLTGQPAKGQYEYAMTTEAAFAQDTWKASHHVTLTYGLRWDDFGNPYPIGNTVLANFFLGPGQTFSQQVANGSMIQRNHVFNHALSTVFSPRVGIAWSPTGSGHWVIRGGFGVYHDWPTLGNDENGLKGNPPGWVVPTFLTGTTTAPVFGEGTSNTYPFGFPYPAFTATGISDHGGLIGEQPSVGGIDPNLSAPDTYNYTVTLERALGHNFVASAGYSGSHSTGLIIGSGQTSATSYGVDVNRFAGDLIQNKNVLTRLNPAFGSIGYAENGARATYNALILAIQGRIGSRGFINASYTRSSSYDDSQVYPTAADVSPYYGPSDWNAPNRFSMTETYEIPGPHSSNSFIQRIAGGWEISSSTILQSGLPYTVFTTAPFEPLFNAQGNVTGFAPGSGDYNADGVNFDFPNAPAGGYGTATSRQAYLNGVLTAANFSIPQLGTEGNEQYNRFQNPGYADTDFALIKDTQIKERLHLQLRFEFYNLFNRPNLTGVDSNLPDSTFGKSTSQYNPRWIQFGANLLF